MAPDPANFLQQLLKKNLVEKNMAPDLYFDLVRYMKCTFSRWYVLTVGFMIFTW
jgi:hypothetical protein